MLVISRRIGERIVIDKDTVLEVLKFDRGKVYLGFAAPRSVSIEREEKLLEKDHEDPERLRPIQ